MYLLLKRLEAFSSGTYIADGNLKTWNNFLDAYWELMNCLEATKRFMKALEKTCRIIFKLIEGLQTVFLACAPGVIVETIKSHMKRIRNILTRQLYLTKDLQEKADIETFLKFMALRPPALCLWGVVPVDMRLPLGLLSLSTTYLIVIVQFYHLFD
ncbi:hypothetical protein EVAR_67353_1 [Eumeta japonica]|uniref:Gustatory receptor n=1 Tax=Eumeta variegata TaxID=151549 RepID=A0A4C2A7E4_EUMVA|nr:hypothetical protein EVAR_67353_1 [Eumeta japonica]